MSGTQMVEVGTLPSHQLLRQAAILALTAAQQSPKPADVKTFQLREAREKKWKQREGICRPNSDDHCFIAGLQTTCCIPSAME